MPLSTDGFRDILVQEKRRFSYSRLEEEYGVNRYYLWNIINKDDYLPPPHVQEKLYNCVYKPVRTCDACGEVHTLGVCPEQTPVTVTVHIVSAEQLAAMKAKGQTVTIVRRRPRKQAAPSVPESVRLGSLTEDERRTILSLPPKERKRVLLDAVAARWDVT